MDQLLVYLVLSLPLIGAYLLLSLGITVIYQSSRVLNLAHGAIAMGAAYATYQASVWGLPLPLSIAIGILVGVGLALAVERVFVRRLRKAGATTQTVGTVAALTLSIAVASRVWGTLPVAAPHILPKSIVHIGSGFVSWELLGIFPIALVGATLLFIVFRYTAIGLAMRGAAQNRRGAALRGVDPDWTATLAWAMGGALAGVAGVLLAGPTALDPFSISLGVLPAFVAALIGRLESLPVVVVGAVVVGLAQGMVPALGLVPTIGPVFQGQGTAELALGIIALLVMALRGARLQASDVRGESL